MKKATIFFCICILSFGAVAQTHAVEKQLLQRAEHENSIGDYESAILDYSKVIEIDSNDPWLWMIRGEAKFKNKDVKGALSDLNKCIQIDSNYSEGYFKRGYIKTKSGDNDGATWDFNKSQDITSSYFDVAKKDRIKGDYDSSLKHFLIALSLHPNDPDIYFEIAIAEKLVHDNFDSRIYFDKAIELYSHYK